MNDEQALYDARQSISEMQLSPQTKLQIKQLAADLACINESYETVVVDVLRKALGAKLNKAFGASVQEWQEVVNELSRIREAGERQWQEFESSHVQLEVQRQQREVKYTLIAHLLARLSPHGRRMYKDIDSGLLRLPRDKGLIWFPESVAELQRIVSLNDEAFHLYETEKLVPELEGYRVTLLQRRGVLPLFREGVQVVRLGGSNEKYTREHFMEVERLMEGGKRKREALETVFDRHFRDRGNYSLESFKKQYRNRHESLIRYDEGLYKRVDKLIREGKKSAKAIGIVLQERYGTDGNKQKLKTFTTAYKEYQRRNRQ